MRAHSLIPALVLALAACQPAPSDVPPTPPGPDLCGADDYDGLVGAPLAAVTLPADLNDRIVGPDDLVTLDYDPTRLNIRVNEAGTITGVDCG